MCGQSCPRQRSAWLCTLSSAEQSRMARSLKGLGVNLLENVAFKRCFSVTRQSRRQPSNENTLFKSDYQTISKPAYNQVSLLNILISIEFSD